MKIRCFAACTRLSSRRVFNANLTIVDFRINFTLRIGAVGMHVAFGRVRHKTAPTGGGECLFVFQVYHSLWAIRRKLEVYATFSNSPIRLFISGYGANWKFTLQVAIFVKLTLFSQIPR